MAAFHQGPVGLLHDQVFIPGRRVAVDILVIIVQTENVSQLHNAARALGEPRVAAALRVGGEDVGVLVVISTVRPAAHDEEDFFQLQVVLEVLGDLGGFRESPIDLRNLLLGAGQVHLAVQQRPKLVVDRSKQLRALGMALQLFAPSPKPTSLRGHLAISLGQRDVISPPQEAQLK